MSRVYDTTGMTSLALKAILDSPPIEPSRVCRWWDRLLRVFRGNNTRMVSGKTFAA